MTQDPTTQVQFERIGKCRLGAVLGRGGMATVFRGHHEDLDLPVAVKILNPALATLPGMAERFLREARLAARIDHPNLVRVYDCGEERDRYYLVMELIEGSSLAERVAARGPVPCAEALAQVRAVARALEAAWVHRILHRDVKPANILLAKDGAVKLADLGLAKSLAADTQLTQAGMIMGTPAYMSPEQFDDRAAVDTRSDLYALGATLYCLLAGSAPFTGEMLQVMSAHHESPRPVPPGVPRAVVRLVARMMAIDPNDRPADPTALIAEIEAVMLGLAAAPKASRRGEGGRPWGVALAGVAGLALLALGVVRLCGRDGGGAAPVVVVPGSSGSGSGATSAIGSGAPVGNTPGVGSSGPSVERVLYRSGSGSGSEAMRTFPIQARVEWLGPDRVRLTYDFEDHAQRGDWEHANSWTTTRIEDGWMVVGRRPIATPEMELAIAVLRLPIRVETMRYRMVILEGEHTNWYAQASWVPESGEWWPKAGVGGVYQGDDTFGERYFVGGDLPEQKAAPDAPRRLGHPYRMEVEIREDQVIWRIDGQATQVRAPQYAGTDRRMALGCWANRVRFDDLVIEGRVGR